MATTTQITELCERLKLSPRAVNIIENIRTSQPSRRVQGGKRNVTTRFASNKMGVVIQAESHTVELAFLREFENDADVLEFWDQPHKIKLSYQAASGRNVACLHTPDYFIITNNGIGYIE